jgi:hypothetical protein
LANNRQALMQNPNWEWYAAKSRQMNGPSRCPFASANRCPRYYESLYLLGSVGIATKIPEEAKIKLDSQWKSFEATIGEEAASISGGEGNDTKAMSNFCPEVSFNIFGLFASGLHPHHGAIDLGMAHARLEREKVKRGDPRWDWANVTPRHYTECPEYSILQGNVMNDPAHRENSSGKTVFNIGTVHGAVGNVSHSPVTFYDNKTINQLLIDRSIPKHDRRELEDIMDDLKSATPDKKSSLVARGEQLILKHKEVLGAATEILVKTIRAAFE